VVAAAGYQRATGNVTPRGGSVVTATGTQTVSTQANNSWNTYNGFSDSVVATQLLWDFDQTYGRYGAAKALSESALANERASQLLIVYNVRAAYFAARANKALAEVARQTVANDQKHLDQINGFVQAGTRSQIDLVQAKTDLSNAQLAQVNAENNYETAKQSLLLAMGSPGSTDFDVADESLPPVPSETSLELQPLVDEALKARPEMEAFIDQARAQTETIASAKGAYGPSISANAGFSQGGDALDNLGWNGYIGVSLSWGIFQGGLTNATVREAEANLRSIAAQTEAERQQIASDVNNARLQVRGGLASAVASREVLVNAKELLRLAEGQYQTGIGSIIQLSDAQVAETVAEAQVIQADFTLAASRALLLKALGRP
jgi:outer membrane protein